MRESKTDERNRSKGFLCLERETKGKILTLFLFVYCAVFSLYKNTPFIFLRKRERETEWVWVLGRVGKRHINRGRVVIRGVEKNDKLIYLSPTYQ